MRRFFGVIVAAIAGATVAACHDTPPTQPRASYNVQYPLSSDEEVFGDIWSNGQRATTAGEVVLAPFGPVTQARLRGPRLNSQTSNPNGIHMFGWYDPADGGGCGSLADYRTGDTLRIVGGDTIMLRGLEAHLPSLPNGGVERHCVRPGQYQFSAGGKSFFLDYVQSAGNDVQVSNSTAGLSEYIEATAYDSTSTNNVLDHVIHVDQTPGGWTEGRLLDVDNAGAQVLQPTFSNNPSPAGTELDYFRFSAARSSSGWSLNNQGTMLARLYWDFNVNKAVSTNYYDAHSTNHLMRWHRFQSHVTQSRNAVVGLELMRPDEDPNDTINVATREVQITVVNPPAPPPCASFEATSTWRLVDQVFNAAPCAPPGPNLRYRWHSGGAGGSWTTWSTDTLHSFSGHSASGTPTVQLQVWDTSTGTTTTTSYPFSVSGDAVVLDGRTFVTDKATNTYRAWHSSYPHVGMWYERFDHDTQWWQATYEERNSMNRIWYAGDYSVSVRQQHLYPGATLARGRLEVRVCNPPTCDPWNGPSASPAAPSDNWSLFGGGPWLSWGGGNVLRFYDLLGAHDVSNRFIDRSWLDADSGRATDTGAGSLLSWRDRSTLDSNARIVEFALATSPSPFTFGLALDPDLGANAADDATGFDAARGMVYVTDGTRAIGYLLRDERGRSALTGVTQYGLQRYPPRLPRDIASAQRTTQVSLLPGRSDVQLLLTTAERPGPVSWSFIMVRGSSVSELQQHADAALALLTAS